MQYEISKAQVKASIQGNTHTKIFKFYLEFKYFWSKFIHELAYLFFHQNFFRRISTKIESVFGAQAHVFGIILC